MPAQLGPPLRMLLQNADQVMKVVHRERHACLRREYSVKGSGLWVVFLLPCRSGERETALPCRSGEEGNSPPPAASGRRETAPPPLPQRGGLGWGPLTGSARCPLTLPSPPPAGERETVPPAAAGEGNSAPLPQRGRGGSVREDRRADGLAVECAGDGPRHEAVHDPDLLHVPRARHHVEDGRLDGEVAGLAREELADADARNQLGLGSDLRVVRIEAVHVLH